MGEPRHCLREFTHEWSTMLRRSSASQLEIPAIKSSIAVQLPRLFLRASTASANMYFKSCCLLGNPDDLPARALATRVSDAERGRTELLRSVANRQRALLSCRYRESRPFLI